jgi:hypothetical protein
MIGARAVEAVHRLRVVREMGGFLVRIRGEQNRLIPGSGAQWNRKPG